jgi:hypothetical protein
VDNIDVRQTLQDGIYTLDGRRIGNVPASSDMQSMHLPVGVYVVRTGKTYSKIVVR